MIVPRLIERKRDGGRLEDSEWKELVRAYAAGEVPDYQMSALLMAIYFRGLDRPETSALTDAMIESGGRLDLSLGRKFTADRRQRHIGFKRHYGAGLTAPDVIELHPFSGGYLGAQPIEGSRSNLCGLVHQSKIASLKGGWPRFTEGLVASSSSLRALFEAAKPVQDEFLSSDPVIFRAKEPIHEGAILIGDSAGLIDPLTGNGMAMAIQSAAVAAPFALAILGGGDRTSLLRAYARAHRKLFAMRLRWSRLAAAALRSSRLIAAGSAAGIASPVLELFTTRTRATARQIERLVRES